MSRICAARSTEQLRLETTIHEPMVIIAHEVKQESAENLMPG